MSTIDQAAETFDREMNGGGAARETKSQPESIFDNSAVHEDDLVAGGDTEQVRGERRERKQPKEDKEDEVLFDENGDPITGDEVLFDENGDPIEEGEEDPDAKKEEDEDEEDDDAFMDRIVSVMVDGEEVQVPVREALDGYIRTNTFHQRLNKLEGVRKELNGHAEKIVQDRKRADEILSEAEELIAGLLPKEPDWDKLFEEDPKAARDLQKQYDAYKSKIEEIRGKRRKASDEQSEKEKAELADYAQKEFPRFAAAAKWRDKDEMTKDLNSMRKTAIAVGFSEDEVAQVLDSRMLHVLLKASKYDRMMAARPRAVKTAKTPVTPGAGSKSTAQRGITGAQKRLAKTGSIDDAATVFASVINRS